MKFHIYFHSPCFDGIVSSVLLYDFLSRHRSAEILSLHAVNYHLKESWPQSRLEQPCAVLDFLYHPDAQMWFDHHATTFLTPELRTDFQHRKSLERAYDPTSSSCAMQLWHVLTATFGFNGGAHFTKVLAADATDSARYESPSEAVLSASPALRINASLALGQAEEYSKFLVIALLSCTLEEVAELPVVVARYRDFRRLTEPGLERFSRAARLEDDGIVVFDVEGSGVMISRYAPFFFFPHARYSVGIIRRGPHAKLTAMRNPWLEFESIPLGEIFKSFGGGGHRRVASAILEVDNPVGTAEYLRRALLAIRGAEASLSEERVDARAVQLL